MEKYFVFIINKVLIILELKLLISITNIFRKVSFPCLFPLPYIMLNCAKLPKINYFIIKNAISVVVAATAKSLQSCPTLCDPIDGSPRGSSTPGILQARTLEWVAISFSNA